MGEKIFIGIDPGTAITGYGVLFLKGKSLNPVDYGVIRPPSKEELPERYWLIYSALKELFERHSPHTVAVETQFMQKNAQSALKLGMARAAVIIAAKSVGAEIVEITPTTAKKAVAGSGRASKEGVQRMVQTLLRLEKLPTPEDAADALALAIAAVHRNKEKELMHV